LALAVWTRRLFFHDQIERGRRQLELGLQAARSR
jgi:hypothetical protein